MTIRITDNAMTSDITRLSAQRAACGWTLSWLPGRTLDRNQAITGVLLAEAVAEMQADEADHTPHLDAWAAELDLTGPDAFVRVSESSAFDDDEEGGRP